MDGGDYSLIKKASPLDDMTSAKMFAEAHGYLVKQDNEGRPLIMRGKKIIGGTIPSTSNHHTFNHD